MYNYFNDDPYLLKLIYNPYIDKILKKIIDENYVLQSSNAQNRLLNKYKINKDTKDKGIGHTWHTDSRYLGGKRIGKGFSYLVIIALDEFSKINGPTKFIPGSLNKTKIPPRVISKNSKHRIKELIMKEQPVCIMDTGLWHRAGKSSLNSRWSIFNIYSGWFVKPYFNYKPMYKKKIKEIYKKLLHSYSAPPEMNEKRSSTVKKFKQ
jgi:ectoine hydroxylase-related dioxygenase (phytanoyl-CoA dioxygenase family)